MATSTRTNRWELYKLGGLFIVAFFIAGAILGFTVAVGSAADVELTNETVNVDADTSTAWAEVTNDNATADANVTVTFSTVDNGTETQIDEQNLTVGNGTTSLAESPSINGSANDSVRIVAVLDNSTVPQENVTVDVGTFQKSTGGVGVGGTSGTEIGVGALALGVVAVLLLRGRDD